MYIIVLEAGHGGADPGACGQGEGTPEKNITLAVANQAGQFLAEAATVKFIRTADVDIPLADRAAAANAAGADIYISIHCNGAANSQARGIETFCYPGSSDGRALAASIQNMLMRATGCPDYYNRGVKEADFAVLRLTVMPAALAEIGFITNQVEGLQLQNPDYQRRAAWGIAKGAAEYLGLTLTMPAPEQEVKTAAEMATENETELARENALPMEITLAGVTYAGTVRKIC